jgi:hypothetical protein
MSNFCWIDLEEAAVRLSSTPEDVKSLVDDAVLNARSFDGIELVVRSDEVDHFAEICWINKPAIRGPHTRNGRGRNSQ